MCRALVTEPTGNLDPDNRDRVIDILFRYAKQDDAPVEVEPGSSLYYSDEGKGTPILFVPGWTMTSEVFASNGLPSPKPTG